MTDRLSQDRPSLTYNCITNKQVEHPVTEYVSGEDLVEHMLWVAAGEPLPQRLIKAPVPFDGWAMEARVYAEDPLRNFLPSTGRLITYKEPTHMFEEKEVSES